MLSVSLIAFEWWRLEQQIQTLGPVHGSVGLMAKIVKLAQQVPNAKVIVAGDSKAERHLDPQVFFNSGIPAINVGVPSGDLWTFVQTFEALGLDKAAITFLISVGSYQINDGHIDKDANSAEQFFSYTAWERLRMFKSAYFLAARKMLKNRDIYLNFQGLIRQVSQTNGTYGHLGLGIDSSGDYACVRFRHNSRASQWSAYRNIASDGARWRLFQEAIRKMERWPGHYILYNSPHSTKGKDCLKGSYGEDLEREFSVKTAAATKGLKRVRFVDFFFHPPIKIDDHYYYDPGHLDKRGAEVFTKWWISYLKNEQLL